MENIFKSLLNWLRIGQGTPSDGAEHGSFAEVEFLISNMTCEGCAERISGILSPMAGVRKVKSKVPQKRIAVLYEPTQVQEQQLKETLDKAGFTTIEA